MIQLLEQSRTGLRLAATCQANEHHLREGGQDINELEVTHVQLGGLYVLWTILSQAFFGTSQIYPFMVKHQSKVGGSHLCWESQK